MQMQDISVKLERTLPVHHLASYNSWEAFHCHVHFKQYSHIEFKILKEFIARLVGVA